VSSGDENALQQPRQAYGEQGARAERKEAFLELAAEQDAAQFLTDVARDSTWRRVDSNARG
jgi:hypothetical protein